MSRFRYAVAVVPRRGTGQDRAVVVENSDRIVIALADGAGGTGGGDLAAQAVIDAVAAVAPTPPPWASLLAELDGDPARLGHGETTAVVVSVTEHGVVGASVGDSGAWIVRGTTIVDLTAGQTRKPLLGAECLPFIVHAGAIAGGTLLVASDGLLKYAKRSDIARVVGGGDLATVARALVDLVRLPSGDLQDDVAIVLCRDA